MAMEPTTRAVRDAAINSKLEVVESLMQQIMETFDVTHANPCEHCGSRQRNNWTDYQANEHASLIVNRISKIRNLLEWGEVKNK